MRKSKLGHVFGFVTIILTLCILLSKTTIVFSQSHCVTNTILVTLNGEQVSFCAPVAAKYTVVEDSVSDQYSSYAMFSQVSGYAFLNIKSTLPGNAPAIGRPIYKADNTGDIQSYRQDVLTIESAKTDRTITPGPIGTFWGEQTPSLQIQATLPIGKDGSQIQVTSLEWAVEHNQRLWTIVAAWDNQMNNANAWNTAANDLTIGHPDTSNTTDTAFNLGKTRILSDPQTGPGDVGTPPWWNGNCNDGNYYPAIGLHSFSLGGSWHNVIACGPRPAYTSGNPDHLVHFYTGAWGAYEFECVELVLRFFYMEWSIGPFQGNGNMLKDHIPSSMTFYPNGNHNLLPGDAITENASVNNSSGHTAIVTSVNLDANGNGTINIIEQNASSSGSRSLHVTNWNIDTDGSGNWAQSIQGWIHANANVASNPPMPANQNIVRNGDFSAGTSQWTNISGEIYQVSNNILSMYAPTSSWGAVIQDSFYATALNSPFEATFQLGSVGPDTKTVSITLSSIAGNGGIRCNFQVAPNSPIQTYTVRGLAGANWNDFRLAFLDGTVTSATTTLIKNVSVVYNPNLNLSTTQCMAPVPADTIGLFAPPSSAFYLRNSNSAGNADMQFTYGPVPSNLTPLAGNWASGTLASTGLYDPGGATFYLKNANSSGNADTIFQFGTANAGLIPIAGDWTGKGYKSVGLYDPATATFYLKNTNSAGNADNVFQFGPTNAGLIPIVGDWTDKGYDSVGLYSSANAFFYLKNANNVGNADIQFQYGPATGNGGAPAFPLVGKWTGGFATIGVYVPANAYFYLKNRNSAGNADIQFQYGPGPNAGWLPLTGHWGN